MNYTVYRQIRNWYRLFCVCVCRQIVCTVSCYTVSADRLYVLCHVIQCLQADCMYCVMLHSVSAGRLYALCHVIQCLQADCMHCVMLYSVCRQTVCTVSCYIVSADRLYVLCHVIQCRQTDCTSTYLYSYQGQAVTSLYMQKKFYIMSCSV